MLLVSRAVYGVTNMRSHQAGQESLVHFLTHCYCAASMSSAMQHGQQHPKRQNCRRSMAACNKRLCTIVDSSTIAPQQKRPLPNLLEQRQCRARAQLIVKCAVLSPPHQHSRQSVAAATRLDHLWPHITVNATCTIISLDDAIPARHREVYPTTASS